MALAVYEGWTITKHTEESHVDGDEEKNDFLSRPVPAGKMVAAEDCQPLPRNSMSLRGVTFSGPLAQW